MKILVAGKNGQVALSLLDLKSDNVEIVAFGRPELDITDKSSIEQALDKIKPDIVVNAAAYTAVDKAEDEPQNAFSINRDGPKNLAEATATRDLPFIHISTDYVFTGNKEDAYVETDPVGPLSVYGLSKLEGEWAVEAANKNHIIFRTAWVHSPYGNNFVKTMLRLAESRDEISVVSDQYGTPTRAAFIAQSIINACHQILSPTPPKNWRGIFHLVEDKKMSWAQFAEDIFAQSKENGGPFAKVNYITTAQYPTKAKRPKNSVLCNQKFKNTFVKY